MKNEFALSEKKTPLASEDFVIFCGLLRKHELYTKKNIRHLMIYQNCCFGQFYPSRIEIFQNSSASFESVSLMRGKFEGTRENLKHKNPAIV